MPPTDPADGPHILSNDPDPLRGALIDSRQRWRDLVLMHADFAFETDAQGHLTFVIPDPAMGWPAGMLVGQPASLLLASPHANAAFDPFHVTEPVRRRRVWLKRGDGGGTCLSMAAVPMLDADGSFTGVRGA